MAAEVTEQQGGGQAEPVFAVNTARGFAEWLSGLKASLAFTTYQVGKLFFIGVKRDGKVWVHNRNIGRCLGLAAAGPDIWVTADTQIFRLRNALAAGEREPGGADALYVPQMSYFTGDLDVHDLAVAGDGSLVFANTLFNCVARASATHSFEPLWTPPFISRLAAEDRCHLNGLALRDGVPRYVTAVAASDTFDGWRSQRHDGGLVLDIETGETLCSGLSMPHSPRWHDGRLWLHNSGTGEFGFIEEHSGRFEAVAFCPGYLRGLSFTGRYAVMGLSRPRDNKTFSGLALDAALTKRRIAPRCGLYAVDLRTGDIAQSLTMEGVVSELYDVVVLEGLSQPAALGPSSPDIKRTVTIGP